MRNDWGPGVRCIYIEEVCSREVVGPVGGEWLKEMDTSSVRWRGGKGYTRVLRWNYSAEAWMAAREFRNVGYQRYMNPGDLPKR